MTERTALAGEFMNRLSLLLVPVGLLYSLASSGGCPAGQVELRPNIRALPPTSIAMLDANNIKFSASSWNSGDAKLELVARDPQTDPATGQLKQPVDQRVYCSGGSFYDRPAGSAEYHPAHNHVHYNDYANYILEPADGNTQNPRQGSKTTFCIMDTTGVNAQLRGASPAPVFDWCPTQDPSFNTQGMSVGWGDTYGSHLAGQSLFVGDLAAGMYRLRHVFDPKNMLLEKADDDNASCRLLELGDGANGRYVADRGPCEAVPKPAITGVAPRSIAHGTCAAVTITGSNLAPELVLMLSGGTGPLPSINSSTFDTGGQFVTANVCVPKAKGGRNPKLGARPVWDLWMQSSSTASSSNVLTGAITVTP